MVSVFRGVPPIWDFLLASWLLTASYGPYKPYAPYKAYGLGSFIEAYVSLRAPYEQDEPYRA